MLPEEFLKEMKELLGDEGLKSYLKAMEQEPLRALRLNPEKSGEEGTRTAETLKELFHLEPVEWEEEAYYFTAEDRPGRHPYHEAGLYYIQEPSAMLPVNHLDVKPGMRVLDLCAAPGGKSAQIAWRLKGQGILAANEIHPERARILSLNMERMGIWNSLVLNEAPDRLSAGFRGFFDRILVDAPCSGEGMFRKNPEAVNEWSPENVLLCAKRQDAILEEAVKMLAPGGVIVYSTCTFSREEDEGTVERFLKKYSGFACVESKKLLPCEIRGEGHFYAVLSETGRTEEQERSSGSFESGFERGFERRKERAPEKWRERGFQKGKGAGQAPEELFLRFEKEELSEGALPEGKFLRFGEQLYLAPPEMPSIDGIRCLRPGLHLGTVKKDRFLPSHALALYLKSEEAKRTRSLSIPEAEIYLAGGTLPADGTEKGWCLMTVGGLPAGWGKSDGRLIKNHYPKGLRKYS